LVDLSGTCQIRAKGTTATVIVIRAFARDIDTDTPCRLRTDP
jgi:hypothetical protein